MTDHDSTPNASADDRIDELVRALPSTTAPAGFADRVLVVHHKRRRTSIVTAVSVVATVALGAFVVVTALPDEGTATATGRESVQLGGHAVAVLEPSAALTFRADARPFLGGVRVEQTAGRAFYRVDKGTPLTVHTKAGDVVVHGTCFTVSLEEDPMAPFASSSRLKAGITGAVAGALLSVVVLEGAVRVSNAHGDVELVAGQSASARSDAAPAVNTARVVDEAYVRRLRAENEDLKAQLDNAQAAAGGDAQKLVAENRALHDKLRHDDEQLASLDASRADAEGKPRAFPKDLPARFTQDALLKSFTAALKEAGIDGDVTHIDCDEFPCIVYGDVKAGTDIQANEIGDKLHNAPSYAQYKSDEDNDSWWRSLKKNDDGKTDEQTMFGIALWPKSDNGDHGDNDDIAKRISFRNQQMWNAMKPVPATK